ncbi:SPOR domain-containing protein [Novosphingobium mathurense]|uniref:Sel1 repeat-containing protein n=1 Tax=Novosphingobium mathurense TaxID=428990 RepID=A0A1U6GSM6_9SPHN|nr:SPOR domain-containing protein [Novosphingobium mathurense]SLJ86535.1 Sel1 repeat-containing protein [Novosphingobium mathurense]
MKKFLRFFRNLGLCATLLPLVPTPAFADVKAGVDAWTAGDYAAAVREWKPLAATGDPDAQFNLAQAYKMGRGVPEDIAKAKDLYGKAAAQGHVQAADIYGLLLFQDGERAMAMPYLEASAARGDPRAQYIIGVAHFNGDHVAKDWVRAYALVSLAQQAGLQQATNALKQMDEHIPLADRQKSVALASRIAADAQATRERETATAELGNGTLPSATRTDSVRTPQIVTAENAVAEAVRATGSASPATAGADYTRKSVPAPGTPSPATAKAKILANPAPKKPVEAARPTPTGVPNTSGPWRVQLGAFGVAGNAERLWAKVSKRPELVGHGKILAPEGRLTKLQAGGFASKNEADAACSRLSAGGFTCLPVRN